MPSLRHLKELFTRCTNDIHAATVAINATTQKIAKLQKLRETYKNVIRIRSEELQGLKIEIEKMQKHEIKEGITTQLKNLFKK